MKQATWTLKSTLACKFHNRIFTLEKSLYFWMIGLINKRHVSFFLCSNASCLFKISDILLLALRNSSNVREPSLFLSIAWKKNYKGKGTDKMTYQKKIFSPCLGRWGVNRMSIFIIPNSTCLNTLNTIQCFNDISHFFNINLSIIVCFTSINVIRYWNIPSNLDHIVWKPNLVSLHLMIINELILNFF